ncbi:MAG: IS1380 family transposase [Candidatus Micrarchaeaceae archaeon]|jgi:hypothetical protein
MQNSTQTAPVQQLFFDFPDLKKIVGTFDGPKLSSDGGLVLCADADLKLKLSEQIADCLDDARQSAKVVFSYAELIRQRLNMIATGNEDLNDADRLSGDPMHKLAAGRNPESDLDLASDSTLGRLEHDRSDRELQRLEELLVHLWVQQQKRVPFAVTIDLDGTNGETHGAQQLSLFNGYYGMTCYQPLFGFIGSFPIIAKLRPGNVEPAEDALSCLKTAVRIIRKAFPGVRIYLRADAGFPRPELYDFCEENNIIYYIGLPTNSRLKKKVEWLAGIAKRKFLDEYGKEKPVDNEMVRVVHDVSYAAEDWLKRRRVIARCDYTKSGPEFRCVVTNHRGGRADWLYEEKYCKRARCENHIKELKFLKCDRLSNQEFSANRFRLLMHTFAYILLHTVREACPWSERQISFNTLILRFIKVAVQVTESARRILLSWPTSYPAQQAFARIHLRLTG